MTTAFITPGVLTWARQRRNLDVEALASKVHVKPAAVSAWESGGQRPTFRQAINAANALRVPLGYLYLSEPPDLKSPLPDFRTLSGHSNTGPSPDMVDLIVDVVGKQEWYRENQESEGAVDLPFVGRFSPDGLPQTVAKDIRDVLGIDEARRIASTSDDFVRELSRNAEDAGIMVMRSGVVGHDNTRPLNVDEFRGFAISDPVAPLVFVNGRDAKAAQVFTIVHEMVHIWTGQGGVSTPYEGPLAEARDVGIERFCDNVAAESLVPADEFVVRWHAGSNDILDQAKQLAQRYLVSSLVTLRRAHDLNLVEDEEYWLNYNKSKNEIQPKRVTGGNFHYTLPARNGALLTAAAISGAASGRLMANDAAAILGVTLKALVSFAKANFGTSFGLD